MRLRFLPLALILSVSCSTASPIENTTESAVVHTHHAFDYIELSAPDLEAQRAFYGAVFGMTFTEYGPDYLGMAVEGREIGGLERGPFRGKGGPLVVLYSDDIEATRGAIEAAGGTISQPITPFPGGRRLHFIDPAGYELAVWGTPEE